MRFRVILRRCAAAVLVLPMLCLPACGKKGPLYLPDEPTQYQAPAAQPTP